MPTHTTPSATTVFPPSKLPKNSSKVPRFNELRHRINYGEDRKPLGPTFWKHLQVFRELYRSPSGVPGQDFIKWKDQKHKDGLTEMAVSYLDTQGNGPKFWPSDSEAAEYNDLQYSSPVDRAFIKATLIQLLFRLNRQQSSNDKYKRKKKDDLSKPHRPQNEHTSTPVISSAPTTQHAAPHIGTSAEAAKYTISTFALSTVPPDLIDPALPITGTGESEADPYLIPESPTFGPNDGQFSFQVNLGKDLQSKDDRPNSPPTRSKSAPETGRDKSKQRKSKRKRSRADHAPLYRNPPRLRRPPQRLRSMASSEAIDEACRSSRSSTEQSDSIMDAGDTSYPGFESESLLYGGLPATPDASTPQHQSQSSLQPTMNGSAEEAPETALENRDPQLEATETEINDSQEPPPQSPCREDPESDRWPPAPFVEDADEPAGWSLSVRNDAELPSWQLVPSAPNEPSSSSLQPGLEFEDNSTRAPEPSRSESHTLSSFPASAPGITSPCDTHPFGNDEESAPLGLSQASTLPVHSDPAYPPAPEAIMELVPMDTDKGMAATQDQLPFRDIPQVELLQSKECPVTQPLQSEPLQTEPLQTEPPQTETVQHEVDQTEPLQTEPLQTEPPQAEPPQTETVQHDVVQKEHRQSEPFENDAHCSVEAAQSEEKTNALRIDLAGMHDQLSLRPGVPCDEQEKAAPEDGGLGTAVEHIHKAVPQVPTSVNRPAEPVEVEYSFMLILSRFPYWQGREWVPKGNF